MAKKDFHISEKYNFINALMQLLMAKIEFIKSKLEYSWNNSIKYGVICFVLIFISKTLTKNLIEAKIPVEIYESKNLITSYVLHNKINALCFIIVIFYPLFSIFLKPTQKLSKSVKIILYTSLGIIWFSTVFIPPNWYFNNFYLFDRVLISLLFLGSLFYYPLVIPFWFSSLLFIKQLQHPDIFYFSFTDKKIFFDLLFFSILYLNLKRFFKIPDSFYFVSVWSILSTWYFLAGYGKIEIGWWHNKIQNLFYAAISYGWLYDMPELKQWLHIFLNKYNKLLIIATVFVEIGAIAVFINRKYAITITILLGIMHLCIFAVSGIFFWKWMILLIAIVTLLSFKESKQYFKLDFFYINIVNVILIISFFKDTKLSWFDSGIINYHLISFKENKQYNSLDASFFSPYDFIFAQNRFYFLENRPRLIGAHGALNVKSTDYLEIMNKKESSLLYTLLKKGKNRFDPIAKERFIQFVKTFITNKNAAQHTHLPIYAPNHEYLGLNQKRFNFTNSNSADIEFNYYEIDVRNINCYDTLFHNIFHSR